MPTPVGWNFSVKQIAALGEAIGEFDPRTVERGERYHRQKRVLSLEPAPDGFQATVAGTETYEVTWTLDGRRWDADCTCPVGLDCKHAYAAALAAMGAMVQTAAAAAASEQNPRAKVGAGVIRDSRTPAERFADETGTKIAAARDSRPLKAAERRFLLALHKVWTEVRDRHGILPHQLARLGLNLPLSDHERWGVAGPLLAGWWEPPLKSPLELGSFLAAFTARRGGKWPEFLAPVTDPAAAEAAVARRERERAVNEWRDVFSKPPPPGLELALPVTRSDPMVDMRLRLTAPAATWEARRAAEDAHWTPVKPSVVKGWLESALMAARPLPEAGRPLLQALLLSHLGLMAHGRTFPLHALRLASEEVRAGLAPLLTDRALLAAGSVVAADGAPLVLAAEAARWRAELVPDAADDLRFALARADGTLLPADAPVFPGRPGVVLDGNTLHPLPPAFPGSAGYTPTVVPREALQTPAALRTLRRLRAETPPDALPPHEIIALRPVFRARMRWEEGGSDLLEVELLARSADGTVEQRRGPHGWTGGGKRSKDGPERLLELESDDGAALALARLNAVWSDARRTWTSPVTRDFPERFIAWAESVREDGFDLECAPDLAGLLRAPDRARLEVNLDAADGAGRDWFDLKLVARPEDTELSPEEIRLLLAASGRFVRLPGKGWRRMELDVSEEHGAALRELGVEPASLDPAGETQRFHALQLAGDEKIAGLLPGEHAARLRQRAAELRAVPPPPLPAGLRATLRPYQEEGFQFLAFLSSHGFGGVLADDMGLGKTVQALAWLLWLRGEQGKDAPPFRALVVCPKSVTHNWFSEAARFAPELRVHVFRPSAPGPGPGEAEVVVANYTQLRLASERFKAEAWTAAILDEGQNIKNPSSQTAGVARELAAEHRLVLTGTPIENRLLDLWSLFAFAMPGLLGNRAAFGRLYGEKADAAAPGGEARERLARRTRHFLLRRTKAQVAPELPPRVEEDLLIDLEGKQRALYDAELKRARQALLALKTPREFDQQRFHFLQSLLRLRQICGDPALVGHTTGAGSAKRDALWETVEPLVAEGHKVLIFSQFVTMLELLAEDLRERAIGFLMLTGRTENRAALVEEFQTSPAASVFLLSLKAAGTGLNLTAASYVVLYDPWWNPAVEAQAIDRTHRIGQANPVLAYRLLARGTVEEKIRQMQREKAALAASVVGEDSLASVMDLESLRFVLG